MKNKTKKFGDRKKIKVAFIGRTYLTRTSRDKIIELSKFRDIDLTLFIPWKWKNILGSFIFQKNEEENYKIIPLNIFFKGHGGIYFYHLLFRELNNLRPDIIHLEEDPRTLVAFQTILIKKLFHPKSKIIILTQQNIYNEEIYPPFSFFRKFNLKNVDLILCGNKDGQKIIREEFNKSSVVLTQLGINLKRYKKINTTNLKKKLKLKGFVIGFVGRLVEEKGLSTLIEAVSKIRENFSILFVGEGNFRKDLVKQAENLKIKNKLFFTGAVKHHEVPYYLNCMDVLVLSSITTKRCKEQFGHVLIEAMACSVPVIGSNSGEIPNVIANAGLIFKEKNVEDLKNKLEMLIKNNKLRKELIKKGKERVLEYYTNKKIALKTYKLYKYLIKRNNKSD